MRRSYVDVPGPHQVGFLGHAHAAVGVPIRAGPEPVDERRQPQIDGTPSAGEPSAEQLARRKKSRPRTR